MPVYGTGARPWNSGIRSLTPNLVILLLFHSCFLLPETVFPTIPLLLLLHEAEIASMFVIIRLYEMSHAAIFHQLYETVVVVVLIEPFVFDEPEPAPAFQHQPK